MLDRSHGTVFHTQQRIAKQGEILPAWPDITRPFT
jgi:hypothetical protein